MRTMGTTGGRHNDPSQCASMAMLPSRGDAMRGHRWIQQCNELTLSFPVQVRSEILSLRADAAQHRFLHRGRLTARQSPTADGLFQTGDDVLRRARPLDERCIAGAAERFDGGSATKAWECEHECAGLRVALP